MLLDGEDMFRPAWQQKEHSLDSFIWMSMCLADYYEKAGYIEKAKHQLHQAKAVILQLQNDEIPPFWKENYYISSGREWVNRIETRLAQLGCGNDASVKKTFDSYRRFY